MESGAVLAGSSLMGLLYENPLSPLRGERGIMEGMMEQVIYVVLGLIAGVFGGLFGIGGATMLVPAFIYLLGLTQHQAQGTTLAIMIPPIGILAAWRYWQAGNVKLAMAAFVCAGFLIGGLLGANLAHHVADLPLKRLFGAFLMVVALRMMIGK